MRTVLTLFLFIIFSTLGVNILADTEGLPPEINLVGLLIRDENGDISNEQMQWQATIYNPNRYAIDSVIEYVSTLPQSISIQSVDASIGVAEIDGQTVTVAIDSLGAEETATIDVFADITASDTIIDASACLYGQTIQGSICAQSASVTPSTAIILPRAGETPWWRPPLIGLMVLGLFFTIIGAGMAISRRLTGTV